MLTAAGDNLETLKIIERRFWLVWNPGLKSSSGPIGSVDKAGIGDDDIHWVYGVVHQILSVSVFL